MITLLVIVVAVAVIVASCVATWWTWDRAEYPWNWRILLCSPHWYFRWLDRSWPST